MWGNTKAGWGVISIMLHWLSAITIVGLFALGWWMTGLGYYDPWYNLGPWVHRSIGILLFAATLARIVWRWSQPTPRGHGSRLAILLAHLGHVMLYVTLLVVMTTGYLISTADGSGISVFGWFVVPALVQGLPQQSLIAGDLHWYSAWGLTLLAAGHSLAAFKHHFHDRYDTLRRMLKPASR
ncbi:cytochrome b [Halomonas sp. 5021]|uniref:cytochrome b n=1 Tax=unclassified Halomonas TaxID=2609666 RepID=UPI0018EFAC00|nr:cytochrome b [Halomonas sp. A40-4]QPL47722.1 cytochrome b [Halomonas sp. A40-4]